MLNNLSSQQFSRTTANTSQTSTNGQSAKSTSNSGSSGSGTTTVISVKGSAPNISTRSN